MRSSGIQAGSGFVDDDQLGFADQCLGDAEALAHATGKGAQLLLAHVPQVHLPQQRFDQLGTLAPGNDALEDGVVIEHRLDRDLGVDAEILGQVAQHPPGGLLVGQQVLFIQPDGARIGILQGGDGTHQRGLAGPVGAQQAEHAARNIQGNVVQCPDAIVVGLAQIANAQHGVVPA